MVWSAATGQRERASICRHAWSGLPAQPPVWLFAARLGWPILGTVVYPGARLARRGATAGFALLPFLVLALLLAHALSQQVSKSPQALRGLLVCAVGLGCRFRAWMPGRIKRQRDTAFLGVDVEHGRFDLVAGVDL